MSERIIEESSAIEISSAREWKSWGNAGGWSRYYLIRLRKVSVTGRGKDFLSPSLVWRFHGHLLVGLCVVRWYLVLDQVSVMYRMAFAKKVRIRDSFFWFRNHASEGRRIGRSPLLSRAVAIRSDIMEDVCMMYEWIFGFCSEYMVLGGWFSCRVDENESVVRISRKRFPCLKLWFVMEVQTSFFSADSGLLPSTCMILSLSPIYLSHTMTSWVQAIDIYENHARSRLWRRFEESKAFQCSRINPCNRHGMPVC